MVVFDPLNPTVLKKAVFDRRFAALARTGVDLGIVDTWDPSLPRNQRILVPIDVQAFVVPSQGGEATVAMKGYDPDPVPFDAGEVRPAGVHLHWAMPDSLVQGAQSADGTKLELPPLPDRWVVVRALLPEGRSQAIVSGWVIDAPSATVTPLAGFSGAFPAAAPDAVLFQPLDAAYGGSLLWTASYAACEGRFALHDPLDDLAKLSGAAPNGFHGSHAVYTVAGWWTRGDQDPLSGIAGSARLDLRLADLGWLVVHDGDDDEVLVSQDPRIVRYQQSLGLDAPATDPPVEVLYEGKTQRLAYDGILPDVAMPVEKAAKVVLGPKLPTYSTLVHGAVMGVPIDGALPDGADDRPPASALGVAIGLDVDDVVSAFGAEALGLSNDQRLAAERLVAAFAANLLDRFGTADGLSDLEEREHAEGFWSFPGTPLPGVQPDRLRVQDSAATNPTTVGRKGRASAAVGGFDSLVTKTQWKRKIKGLETGTTDSTAPRSKETPPAVPPGATRDVVRAAPRLYRPQPPLLALRGAKPSHRHHDDGLYDESGRLRCRYPKEVVTAIEGVVEGDAILPTLANGAIPDEVLSIVREAILLDPYAYSWLAAAGAPPTMFVAARARMIAETVRLYGTTGTYDPSGRASIAPQLFVTASPAAFNAPNAAAADSWSQLSHGQAVVTGQIAAELARFSLVRGTPPSPIAITTWRQPWVPLWLEWKVTLTGEQTMSGWDLDSIDLSARSGADAPTTAMSFDFVGRATINERIGDALHSGIVNWLAAEQQRDLANPSESQLSDDEEAALGALNDKIGPVDLVSASLDGIREQLLGIPYIGHVARGPVGLDGKSLPRADGLPTPLFGGTLRVDALRLVDAFGRTLDVPVPVVRTTSTLEVAGQATSINLRPRVQHGARWLFRLVDPAHPTTTDPLLAREAFVDQKDPTGAVNPVVGFLLPDHVDEALELFDVAGSPLGQLGHDEITGSVTWEPAPGLPLPPDAGPLAGLDDHTRLAGLLATGVVQADVTARTGTAPPSTSSLSALLRAIDTTLWTVDTFGAIGSPSVAGLVGRPIAVVRATLRLEVPDDVAEVFIAEAGGPDARRAAFAALNDLRFPVRIGDLARSDDSVLGFFVDDDYLHLHVVDKVVTSGALESGRHKGFLGLLGDTPKPDPISHDYLVAEDTLWVRPGQALRLTLLMLPAGKVHMTSGILPRKALALGDDWVTPGLVKLMPSLRVGPVLVDPAEIRLPLVNLLGNNQTFTRRTGPLTWRDDPIVAATQTALLPRMPHEVEEGWVRVTPDTAGSP